MKPEFEILEGTASHSPIIELMLREGWRDRKQHALNWKYHLATDTRDLQPLSALCSLNGSPIGIALGINVDGELQYFGNGVMAHMAPQIENADQIIAGLFQHLSDAAKARNCRSIEYLTPATSDMHVPQDELQLLNSGFQPTPKHFAMIDLSIPETSLKSDIRKSYKSLINFGKREITLDIQTGEDASEKDFSAFRQFHIKIAGRETRPQASWDEMFKLIQTGGAECIYGYYQDALVSCTYLNRFGGTCVYGSGVYDRDLFDKPISHWPLWQAILSAQAKGDQIFDLGECYLKPEASPKEHNIAYFKKGFTSRVEVWKTWKWVSDQSDDRDMAS